MRAQIAAPTLEWAKELRLRMLSLGWVPLYDPMDLRIRVRCWRKPPINIPPELVNLVEQLERPAAAAAFVKFLRREYVGSAGG